MPITGLETAAGLGVDIFHAGTIVDENGQIFSAGGRVLGVTATGADLPTALDMAYRAIDLIHWEGMQYRRDIGRSWSVSAA
jgi:phosphoribosylamine--glycine ligase